MKLSDVLKIEIPSEYSNIEIKGITCDSRTVREGYVFVCIDGILNNGHNFARIAEHSGATVIIAENDTGAKNQIIVEDTRAAYAMMCAEYFGNPATKLKLIGVTGTNGKTSTTYILKNILETCGYKVGLIGTIQNLIGEQILPAKNTTPDAYELHSLFSLMLKAQCNYVVMEVSSQALAEKRVFGLTFEASIFTNLSLDHLDYHKTMENYISAKKSLFDSSKIAVLNIDDKKSDTMLMDYTGEVHTYSIISDQSTFTAKNINYKSDGVDFEMVGARVIGRVKLKTPGEFSVYNAMGAATCCLALGMPFTNVVDSLSTSDRVKGRAEVVPTNSNFTVIIDYAHTPDGLSNMLSTLLKIKKGRIVTLFGCGGDRDRAKRPQMGAIAAQYSDYVIVTSDNPRTEQPSAIIQDIISGMNEYSTPYIVVENRVLAIEHALKNAEQDDIILLAGKGHETYQILSTGSVHLDEREIVEQTLEKLK